MPIPQQVTREQLKGSYSVRNRILANKKVL